MLTEQELRVVGRLVVELARIEGEDVMGVILKTGGFRELPDEDGVVNLAHKLEEAAARSDQTA